MAKQGTTKKSNRSGAGAKRGTFSSYAAAQKFLYDRIDFERTRATRVSRDMFKLDRMRALLSQLGDPHEAVRTVHVAGTKGKGSTCEMAASCLEACGYAVGLYTSPHMVDVRERVRLNGRMISHADFTRLMGDVSRAAAKLDTKTGEPTFFEILTAMAMLYFADQAVDVAVIETGLGGRLDSTNVITPEVSAITAIGIDHTHVLGTTIEEIAREKAGIFKTGVPAITVPQTPEAMATLREVAEERDAPLNVLGEDVDFSYRFESSPALGPHARVCLTTDRCTFEHLPVPLKGEHQAHNCGLALAILDRLTERGFEAPEPKVLTGLESTTASGRLELAWEQPRILLDGAHTPDSVRAAIRAIGAHVPYDSMVMIFGCAADKDVDGMLKEVALGADKVIFTRSKGNPRSTDPADLQRKFADMSPKMTQLCPTVDEAMKTAARAVARDDLVCVIGSFFLAGEAKKWLASREGKRAG